MHIRTDGDNNPSPWNSRISESMQNIRDMKHFVKKCNNYSLRNDNDDVKRQLTLQIVQDNGKRSDRIANNIPLGDIDYLRGF